MSFIYYIVSFLLIINIIVVVHEFGHYLAARQMGVKVETFSIGMGPEIFGFNDKNGTRWCFSLLPVGGYVMMLGDGDASSTTENPDAIKDLSEEEKKMAITSKGEWAKIWIAFGGPFFNYIYAFVVATFMAFFHGLPTYDAVIGNVVADSPAAIVGLQKGDRILSVNDRPVQRFRDVSIAILEDETGQLNFLVDRNGEQKSFLVQPKITTQKRAFGRESQTKMVGVASGAPVFARKSFIDAMGSAFSLCVNATKEMFGMFGKLFAGKQSLDNFGGVVRMAEIAGDLSRAGNFALLIMFTVTLSLNLGFINLFPLPVLDGGRILICFVEYIFGRKFPPKIQEYIMIGCAILLVLLMLLTTVNDILRLEVVNKFFMNIIG